MLKVRVIPTLLWKDVGLVKGKGFDSWRRVGTVLPSIKVYNSRYVDELIIVDITATREDREPDVRSIADFALECFVPLTVGGGITSVDHIKALLRAGADKVSLNSALLTHPGLVEDASKQFGSQCIVASIDAKKRPSGGHEAFTRSGTHATGVDVVELAVESERRGAGEILLTSIDLDGTMEGYDIELIRSVASKVKIPIIASGGAGNYEDMHKALQGGASAVAAASIFHFTEQTPLEAKTYLAGKGVPVRR